MKHEVQSCITCWDPLRLCFSQCVIIVTANPFILSVVKFGKLRLEFTIVLELLLHFYTRCCQVFDSAF